jgi:2-polyprenyl-3-methyl-5-hydroxy-6-metoxy-1,4-benzoquinol methylase
MSEPQYQHCRDVLANQGRAGLGVMTNQTWRDDPKRLGFVLARYKFVARMLHGVSRVLEIGCGDGFATAVVAQAVGLVVAVDFDEVFVDEARQRAPRNVSVRYHDIMTGPVYPADRLPTFFDAAYSLDVFEHIPPEMEGVFLGAVCESIGPTGTFIVGSPSAESQAYASPLSKAGHVNCKTGDEMRETLRRFFRNVYLFGMNDETLHTGFDAMCHYRLAICTGAKV